MRTTADRQQEQASALLCEGSGRACTAGLHGPNKEEYHYHQFSMAHPRQIFKLFMQLQLFGGLLHCKGY